jgi:3'-5' exoribonuclease
VHVGGNGGSVAVSALRAGEPVSGVFACVRKDRLMTRSGAPYLALSLRDRTGTVEARVFQDADAVAGGFERGDLVRATGLVERFRDQLVLELSSVVRVDSDDVDPGLFLPVSYRDLDELDGFLEHLAGEVSDRRFAAFLSGLLRDGELRAAWRRAPCGRTGHHAYVGGLLEHTVAVAGLAYEVCQLHPRLRLDLLLTAAIVHDLGRVREFSYGAEFGLTEEGRLLGHLVLGSRIVTEGAAGVLDEERLLALLHCVLGHHGPAGLPGGRFGSAEAVALHRLNALDGGVKEALEHGLGG